MKKIIPLTLMTILLGGCAHGPVQITLSKLRIGYFDDKTEWSGDSYYTHEETYGITLQWAADDLFKQKE